MLAQAEVASKATTELLKYGLLGIFLVLALVGLVWLGRALMKAWEQRVVDAQQYGDKLKEVNDAGNRVLGEVKTSVDSLERTCSELRSTSEKGFDALEDAVNDLRDEQVRGFAASGKGQG